MELPKLVLALNQMSVLGSKAMMKMIQKEVYRCFSLDLTIIYGNYKLVFSAGARAICFI